VRATVATTRQTVAMPGGNTDNGRPEITDTGARVKAQNGAGYAPPGRNFPIFGHFGSEHLCDPYEGQDEAIDEGDW
jgi:hypothetical protein